MLLVKMKIVLLTFQIFIIILLPFYHGFTPIEQRRSLRAPRECLIQSLTLTPGTHGWLLALVCPTSAPLPGLLLPRMPSLLLHLCLCESLKAQTFL